MYSGPARGPCPCASPEWEGRLGLAHETKPVFKGPVSGLRPPFGGALQACEWSSVGLVVVISVVAVVFTVAVVGGKVYFEIHSSALSDSHALPPWIEVQKRVP